MAGSERAAGGRGTGEVSDAGAGVDAGRAAGAAGGAASVKKSAAAGTPPGPTAKSTVALVSTGGRHCRSSQAW